MRQDLGLGLKGQRKRHCVRRSLTASPPSPGRNASHLEGRRPSRPAEATGVCPPTNGEIKQNNLRLNVASEDGKDESLGIMSKQATLAKAHLPSVKLLTT